jgi:hypothetical protein
MSKDNVIIMKKNPSVYQIHDLVDSPVAIYCITWAVKNLLGYLSARANMGEDMTELLQENYNLDENQRDYEDNDIIHIIHEIMTKTLDNLTKDPNMKLDSLVTQTQSRFRGHLN